MISFQSICQSPRKLWATSDHARSDVSRSPGQLLTGRVMPVAAFSLARKLAGVLLEPPANEHAQ